MKLRIPRNVITICRILKQNGYDAYLVGGSVRDMLDGRTPKDYDIATNAHPQHVVKMFKKEGFRTLPVGIRFGMVSVLINGLQYEVTTYRKESEYIDGRHPSKVKFISDLRTDLERRDFTCNAFGYDPAGKKFIDYFDGVSDMKIRRLRTVGNPIDRFNEDYLRMLRAVRYAARFNYTIESKTLSAIKKLSPKINKISSERILSELTKMADTDGHSFAKAVGLLKETSLLKHILPEIDVMDKFEHAVETHPEGNVWEHTLNALEKNKLKDHTLNLAILFHDIGKPVTFSKKDGRVKYFNHNEIGLNLMGKVAKRLKISNKLKDTINFCILNHMKAHKLLELKNNKLLRLVMDKNWYYLYHTSKCDNAAQMHLFKKGYWKKIDERVDKLKKLYLRTKAIDKIRKTISGHLIMKIKGIPPGPKVGEYIDRTVEWVLNNPVDLKDKQKIKAFIADLN